MKWLRVNSLHSYFSEQGSEAETSGDNEWNNRLSWPGEYGIVQATLRSTGMWLGCKDYNDAKVNQTFPYLVTNIGPKPGEYPQRPISNAFEFKLKGRFDHPIVTVDGVTATLNTLYDVCDSLDENLPADRMIVVRNHTPIGITVSKRVYAFTQQYNNNYYILDYVAKNTGIIDAGGTVNNQTVNGFWLYFVYRYALAGESVEGNTDDQRWAASSSSYGRSVVTDVVGTDPEAQEFNDSNSPLYKLRAHFAFYSPHSERPMGIEDDWGCPNQKFDGILAAAKFVGYTALHADKSPNDPSDDLYQPRTTHFVNMDGDLMQRAQTQYNEPIMTRRYELMSVGHAEKTQAELVAESGLPANEWINPDGTSGGTGIVMGFGPYNLKTGDSIHIVMAGAVAGLNREKNREVGANWLQYFNGTGTPELIMPDGTPTTNHTAYKKAWVWTCKDSLFQTYHRAIQNYESGYAIPQPPPPPSLFSVESGGDRIRLTWADNADSWPHFGGYVIYRSEGTVLMPNCVYRKIFECGKSDVVHQYDDLSATRGFNYYYYIQSRDDGTQNTVSPGTPLVSGMFWTVTSEAATLQRPAGNYLDEVRVVPNPYDIRARALQFGDQFQYDRIAFYGLPPQCKLKIFTESGTLIWEKNHTNGAGDEIWDSMTSSGQIVVSGVYILYVEVTEDAFAKEDKIAPWDIYDDNKKLMFGKDELMFHQGDQIFRKGESKYRKFVVIR
jgi:hypothetical protein